MLLYFSLIVLSRTGMYGSVFASSSGGGVTVSDLADLHEHDCVGGDEKIIVTTPTVHRPELRRDGPRCTSRLGEAGPDLGNTLNRHQTIATLEIIDNCFHFINFSKLSRINMLFGHILKLYFIITFKLMIVKILSV